LKTLRHGLLRVALAATLVLPALCLAHTGADAGGHHDAISAMWSGFLHPFTGADHLAAMLAVGIWSALAMRRVWVAPLAFVSMLSVGAVLGALNIALPAVEPMIAASVLALGLLIAMRWRLPSWAGALVAGTFALFHGNAHGLEFSGPAHTGALMSMLAATALLHAAGIALGRWLPTHAPWLPRAGGVALAAFGVVLLGPFA
jgi:urease accessory protein